MAVKPIPKGYHVVTPYLVIREAANAIDYYKKVFGATVKVRMDDPSTKKVGHAELQIGDSVIMLADEHPEMGFRSPQSLGGSPVSLLIYVDNVDTVFSRAISAGGKQLRPVADQFYGDRNGTLADPFGHIWTVATHVEDVTPEEMKRRMAAQFQHA